MASNNGIACVEYTDTYGGEANYSWVRSYSFNIGDKSPLGIIRTAKKLIGINGVKCKVHDYGDTIEVRPQGSNTVAFITFQDAIPKAV
jgi:hypothetical protein